MYRMALVVIIPGMMAYASVAAEADVSDLIRKYSQSLDNMRSFTIKWDATNTGSSSLIGGNEQVSRISEECRYDGSRASIRKELWGQVNQEQRNVPKENPFYQSRLWDGKEMFQYDRAPLSAPNVRWPGGSLLLGRPGPQKIQTAQYAERLLSNSAGQSTLGYLYNEKERLDTVLLRAKSASLSSRRQQVGSSSCFVVNAETDRATYTVWIDPEHGYNVAKAVAEYKTNNAGLQQTCQFEVARFRQVDGVWVAEEFRHANSYKHPGDEWSKTTVECRATEIVLNPDHDELGSFMPDDIQNGARVFLVDGMHEGVVPIRYFWRNGGIVADIDETVISQIEKDVDQVLLEGSVPSRLATGELPTSGNRGMKLLERYAETQDRLRSFVARAETAVTHMPGPNQPGSREQRLCEFRCDGERVSHRATFWDGLMTTQEKPCRESLLWDGESLICYRQGLDPADNRVFVNDNEEDKEKMIATEYKGAPLMGICAGDRERVDSILRRNKRPPLAMGTEKVGDADCHVIKATTDRGDYTVWIDPMHGHNIVRMEVRRKKGDVAGDGRRVQVDGSFLLTNVRLEKIDDVWVPMEADMEQAYGPQMTRWHHKRTQIALNPDHQALGSFRPTDIPEGTKTVVLSEPMVAYTWKEDRPVKEATSNEAH